MLAAMMNRTDLREDARLNRDRLLTAAREVFRERGLLAEMRDIAERAGLAVGTIYRHYPSKDDLIVALLDDAQAQSEDLSRAIEAMPPIEALKHFLAATLAMVARHGWLIEAYHGNQLSARCREQMQRRSIEFDFYGRCGRVLKRAKAAGLLRPDLDLDDVATLLAGSTSHAACQRLLATKSPEESAKSIVETMLHGIGAAAKT
jgi:AcrR family transcriptional regulator